MSEANADDVDKAVAAAKAAFDIGSPYRSMDASQRGRLLYKLADAVEANMHYLASLETLDNGKPVTAAFGDMEGVVKTLRFNAGYADKIYGKTIPVDGKNFAMTVQEPVGVVGLITAWNFPLFLVANKVAPAVAAGNTVVLKTSEKAPLTALFFASLVKSVGFPPGVINILSGYGPTAGDAIARHNDIELVSFTGSTAVGKYIQKAAGESNSKRVLLECGGKSPLVIMADADLDLAALVAYEGVFINQGQCCCAGESLSFYCERRCFECSLLHCSLFQQRGLLFRKKFMKLSSPRQRHLQRREKQAIHSIRLPFKDHKLMIFSSKGSSSTLIRANKLHDLFAVANDLATRGTLSSPPCLPM